MKDNSLIVDYTKGPVTRQLLRFAWPFMLSNLLQTAYNLADMIIVGQFNGASGLSAVGIGGDLIHFYTFIAMGFCNAGQVMISQYIGLKNREAVSRTVGTMFGFVLLLSFAVMALGLGFNRVFLGWLHVPPEAEAQCLAYTTCCTAGCFFIYGYTMVSSALRGMGDSKHPMVFIAIAAGLNVLLDLLLVGLFDMGALGAALATVVSQGFSFGCALVFLYKRREQIGFDFRLRSFIPRGRMLATLVKLGIPMMLQSCAISISALVVSSFINVYGVTVSAVTGVGNKLSTVASIVTLALSYAGGTMVGQNFAAREFDRVKKILYDSWLIGGVFVAVLSAVIALWPEQVFALFNNDPEVLEMSHAYVPVAIIQFIGWALRGPAMALCNGMGFVAMNFTLGILDGVVVRVGLSVLLGIVCRMGIQGFWYGSAIAGSTFFVVMFPYLLSGKWKKRKPPVAG